MTTKVHAECPECQTLTLPHDKVLEVPTPMGRIPLRVWRYSCECGWTWANELQRRHNDHEYDKALRVYAREVT